MLLFPRDLWGSLLIIFHKKFVPGAQVQSPVSGSHVAPFLHGHVREHPGPQVPGLQTRKKLNPHS